MALLIILTGLRTLLATYNQNRTRKVFYLRLPPNRLHLTITGTNQHHTGIILMGKGLYKRPQTHTTSTLRRLPIHMAMPME
jgi:hypothetical protein